MMFDISCPLHWMKDSRNWESFIWGVSVRLFSERSVCESEWPGWDVSYTATLGEGAQRQ